MKNILVTGGCGFIGSYVVAELLEQEDVVIYNVDKLGVGSSEENIKDHPRVKNYFLDIAKKDFYEDLPKIDYIVHLAAESHVDRSITDPLAFVDSNVKGTANVLELARIDNARMVHVSTDEVYGHLQQHEAPFTEESPLQPRSPYSASKAGSDLLVLSYINTYGLNASITRCCNNYGPRQHYEKFIPTIVNSLVRGEQIPVYGAGDNIREWIFAEDHAKAIIEVLFTEHAATVYNIPGSITLTNLQLVESIVKVIESKYPEYLRLEQDYIKFVSDRLGHDFKYELSTQHELDAVKNQREFDLYPTVKYYVDRQS